MTILVLCGLALVYVTETADATRASYEIGALKAQQQQLLDQQEQVRYRISLAASAGRLDAEAQRDGLQVTPATHYLAAAMSPLALAPREPTSAGPRSLLDTLALVLQSAGHPVDAEAAGR
jgi:hypothetical protein